VVSYDSATTVALRRSKIDVLQSVRKQREETGGVGRVYSRGK
jgi:hypothetical protein